MKKVIRSDIMTKFLIYLLLHRDKVITKEELIENLWNEDEIDNPAGHSRISFTASEPF